MRSAAFTVTVNGKPVDVAHAAASYDYVSFDITGPVNVAITAAEPGFWDRGVDIEPWRLGLRAVARRPDHPLQVGSAGKAFHLAAARLPESRIHALCVCGHAAAAAAARSQGAVFTRRACIRQSLNPKSGDTLYLAPGSYFYGSLNLWKVADVKMLGRGTIVYDGPQDPSRR